MNKQEDTDDLTIEAGRGVSICYIGMPISELGEDWQSGRDLYPETYGNKEDIRVPDINSKLGILCIDKGGIIQAVTFSYREPGWEYATFTGETAEGIGKSSTITDVFSAYGEPNKISRTGLSKKNDRQVTLWYEEAGVVFCFVNEELATVMVAPERHPLFTQDIGDTRELRALAAQLSNQKD